MNKYQDYNQYINAVGVPAHDIYPGDDSKKGLLYKDALVAIKLLQSKSILIIGGDALTMNAGKLEYAYHNWGEQYVYLDWSIDEKNSSEDGDAYLERSYELALKSINEAEKVANKLNQSLFIVFFVE